VFSLSTYCSSGLPESKQSVSWCHSVTQVAVLPELCVWCSVFARESREAVSASAPDPLVAGAFPAAIVVVVVLATVPGVTTGTGLIGVERSV
jgi:hypothetical protein